MFVPSYAVVIVVGDEGKRNSVCCISTRKEEGEETVLI